MTVLLLVLTLVIVAIPRRDTHFLSVVAATSFLTLPRNSVDGLLLDPTPAAGAVNYLVVGSDRRIGVSSSLPALGNLTGEHADSIMLWSVRQGEDIQVLALPRDIRVKVPHYGDRKLGTTLVYGPAAVIQAVRSVTSVPIHHYIDLNFEGFAAIVDAVGGVELTMAAPMRDPVTGLSVPAGPVLMDGAGALRFVRARQAQEMRGGRWVAQTSGDLGRIKRQNLVIAALVRRIRTSQTPSAVLRIARAMHRGVTIDRQFGSSDVAILTAVFVRSSRLATAPCVLPTKRELADNVATSPFPPQHDGSTVMRVVDRSAAPEVLRWLASGPSERPAKTKCGSGVPG